MQAHGFRPWPLAHSKIPDIAGRDAPLCLPKDGSEANNAPQRLSNRLNRTPPTTQLGGRLALPARTPAHHAALRATQTTPKTKRQNTAKFVVQADKHLL